MAQAEVLEQVQQSLNPLFRRVLPLADGVNFDTSQHQSDGPLDENVSILTNTAGGNVIEDDRSHQPGSADSKTRLIIAIDFGTTFSSVAYARIRPGIDATKFPVGKIRCIDNYSQATGKTDDRENPRADNVPTKLLYLPSSNQLDSDNESDPEDNDLSSMDFLPISPSGLSSPRRKKGKKRKAPSPAQRHRTEWTRAPRTIVHWGYEVERLQIEPQNLAPWPNKEVVELMKLALGDDFGDEALQTKRNALGDQVERLRRQGIIPNGNHLLTAFLARLLRHAKKRLEEQAYLDAVQLEYVLCVPVTWSEIACRTMHDAMVKAIRDCNLDSLAQDIIPNLFIVSEPEAAAHYVVASLNRRLRQGEVFVLLDAGGGTVDITTYRVVSDELGPLRLQSEVLRPDGALCGSSLITERYRAALISKLKEQHPTADEGHLIGAATALANEWDWKFKRYINLANKKSMSIGRSGRRWYREQAITWTEEEICDVFEPSLTGTTDLLEEQLRLARVSNLRINKVIVVGGFGESPSLRNRIREVITRYCDANGEAIEMISPEDFPTSAVVRGALLRALDKRNGPDRVSRSSFGFLRHEWYKDFIEHEEAERGQSEKIWVQDVHEHDKVVKNTIYWVLNAGETLPQRYCSKPIESIHTFAPTDLKLTCIERLYVSPNGHRSHFHCDHRENAGALPLSEIVIDMSAFKDEFPVVDKANSERMKLSNRRLRVVTFALVIEVDGKQLKYEAYWPADAVRPDQVRVRQAGFVSLASSFPPGTA